LAGFDQLNPAGIWCEGDSRIAPTGIWSQWSEDVFRGFLLSLFVLPLLGACSSLPGSSEFVCNDTAKEPTPIEGIDSSGQFLGALLNELMSLGANPNFKKETVQALNRCDKEFLIWYVQMSADHPDRLTESDRKRFIRLTGDS